MQKLLPDKTTLTRQTSMSTVGIRTRNPSKQAAAYPRFRQRGHGTSSFIEQAA